jgi:nucleoside-diphosphate kinase
VALVAEGERAIEAFRAVAGATDPVKASPGTIRGDYALKVGQNMVHGSDSPEAAEREIKIFFPELV